MPCPSTKRHFPGEVGKWIFICETNSQDCKCQNGCMSQSMGAEK